MSVSNESIFKKNQRYAFCETNKDADNGTTPFPHNPFFNGPRRFANTGSSDALPSGRLFTSPFKNLPGPGHGPVAMEV